MPDLYSVLGLSRRANGEEIRTAYWTLAKRCHPDVNAGDKAAEQRTKEINDAYETLGDSQVRAVYDLELARQRAKVRRDFWSSAAIGAATFMVTVGAVSATMMWRQHAEIRQLASDEPTQLTGNARDESVVAKLPAEDRGDLRSTALAGGPERRDVSTPLTGPFGEPSASLNTEIASASFRDSHAQTGRDPAAPSFPLMEKPPGEEVASAPLFEPASEMQMPEGQPVPSVPAQDAPSPTELASAAPPEAGVREQMWAGTVDQSPGGEPARRNADRKAAAGRNPKKSAGQFGATEPARAMPNKLQGMERERRLTASSATALRWPSADEPFVNLGGRSR